MDDNLTYVFVAFLVTWVVIGGYLWTLGRQVQTLRDEVDALTDGTLDRLPESNRPNDIEQSAFGAQRQ